MNRVNMWFDSIWSFALPGFQTIELYVFQKLSGAFVPAFFIAGALATFVPKSVIVRYLSAGVRPTVSYSVSLFAGGVLSVCACGILPLFQTVLNRGAGVGPAITFLFSGPAINVIAIIFTYQLLGAGLGNARIIFVILLALILGIMFAWLFQKSVRLVNQSNLALIGVSKKSSDLAKWMLCSLLMLMVLILPIESMPWSYKGPVNLIILFLITVVALKGLHRTERIDWIEKSCFLLKNIVPKLLIGVFMIGVIEPFARDWMIATLTNNSFEACLIAAIIGGILYVGTILGVVAVKGLVTMGMPEGPALALLLAGPSVALPSLIVIISICGKRIGLSFAVAVVVLSAISGWIYSNSSYWFA